MSSGDAFRSIAPAPSRQTSDATSSQQSPQSYLNPGDPSSSSSSTKRKLAVACGACRQRKQRCDGLRPICTPCKTRKTECQYETQPDETRYSAIKRKTENLEKEAQDYKELLTNLRVRPEEEAQEILQRLRTTRTFNINSVLNTIRKGSTMC